MRPFCLLASLTIFMILGLSVPSPGALVAEEAADWINMMDEPGHVVWHATGHKLKTVDDLTG